MPEKTEESSTSNLTQEAARKGGLARAERMTKEGLSAIGSEGAAARWKGHVPAYPRPPKATHAGVVVIGGKELPCYVLEGGRRVLSQTAMIESLGMSRGGTKAGTGDRLAKFATQKALKPFISDNLTSATREPLRFKTPVGAVAYGYEATVLADLCEAVLAADEANELQEQQKHIAQQAIVLVRAFARVGIVALVDEATGYEKDKTHHELQRILAAYINKELLPWTRKFPNEFFKQVFRIYGWDFKPGTARPGYVGHFIRNFVYRPLPPGVLEELQRLNPSVEGRRRFKHFQFLTESTGHQHLDKQIAVVTALMRSAETKATFLRAFGRNFPSSGQQLELDVEAEPIAPT